MNSLNSLRLDQADNQPPKVNVLYQYFEIYNPNDASEYASEKTSEAMEPQKTKRTSPKMKTAPVLFLGKGKRKRTPRIDKIFSSKKMKQREYQDRQNKGYVHRVFCGDEEGLFLYLSKCINKLNYGNPLAMVEDEIKTVLKNCIMNNAWAMDRIDFRLYYIPQTRKGELRKLFKLFLVESKFQEVKAACNKLIKPKPLPRTYHPEWNMNSNKPKYY